MEQNLRIVVHILTVNETVKKPPKKVATSFSSIGGRKNPQKKSLLHSVVREVEKTPKKVRYFILISKKMYDGVGLPCATTAYGPLSDFGGGRPYLDLDEVNLIFLTVLYCILKSRTLLFLSRSLLTVMH